ncbi:MAG: alpha-amylase family protein, partial [Pirellulales bacterium]
MLSDPTQMQAMAAKALSRLWPRLEEKFSGRSDDAQWDAYRRRLKKHFPVLFQKLFQLYSGHYDFFYYLEDVLSVLTSMWLDRHQELKALDALREMHPDWYQSERMVGAACYVDLFAGSIAGVREKIPYLTEMGITYLHLMPLFKTPLGDNDGGYAISSYREVNTQLGTIEELADLTTELRHYGISLVLDFVFNHTSDEHEWAQRSLNGESEYQAYYRVFPDRSLPDAYERTLREVFPDEHPGAFTYRPSIRKWVWTTFHNFQWDLNYENPEVFVRMLEEMLFLANVGVEILRLDAAAFIWKQLGTTCQNLPEAHWIIQAYNAAVQIAAPAMIFKSEAIVHPDEVRKYIHREECQLSYNPQLMALLWNSLATREVKVMSEALKHRFQIPADCEWVNYVRCHDDIGWAISDDDIQTGGYDPRLHRKFLTDFYTRRSAESFSYGEPFQVDPVSGDARVSGTCASLAGLEKGVIDNDENEIELSVRRILLLYGVAITIGGIPLIYLGDEIGAFNDYGYKLVSDKSGDSRWLQRGAFDWTRAELRRDLSSVPGRVFQGLLRLLQLRRQNRALQPGTTEIIETGSRHVFGFFRSRNEHSVLVVGNFTERQQVIEGRRLRLLGLRRTVVDQVAGHTITADREMTMEPY